MPLEKKTSKKEATVQTEDTVFESSSIAEESAPEVTKEPVKEEKEPTFSLSQVKKLLEDSESRLMNIFNSQIQKLKKSSAQNELDEDLAYVAELEDDWLEKPVVFFAFSINFSIHGDKRRGVEVLPPHGAIRFKPLIRTKRKGRRGVTEVVSVSSVKVHSKSVADYLRNHSLFGISFYENMESAMNIDATWAQKMVEAQQSISRLSDMQVIARAKQEGIAINQSPETMRKQLIEKMAKAQIARQEQTLYGSLRAATLDKDGRQVRMGVIPE